MANTLRAPRLYHVGRRKDSNFLHIDKEVFVWVNFNLKFSEAKYLYALMQSAGDGSFAPSAEYIKSITGLDKAAQSKARSALKKMGIIEHEEKHYIKVRYDILYNLARG